MDLWTLETLGVEAIALFTLGWVVLAIGTAVRVLARTPPRRLELPSGNGCGIGRRDRRCS